jgi:hypothetical protein
MGLLYLSIGKETVHDIANRTAQLTTKGLLIVDMQSE